MKRFLYTSAFLVLIAGLALQQTRMVGQTPAPNALAGDPHGAMLNTYCVGCHNARLKTGGVMFDTLDIKHPTADAEI